jgi:multisubunit Na+/H+ antiporter MnhB subunit
MGYGFIAFVIILFVFIACVLWLGDHPDIVNVGCGLLAIVGVGFLFLVVWALTLKDPPD